MAEEKPEVRDLHPTLVDRGSAGQEILVEGIQGFAVVNGNAKFTMFSIDPFAQPGAFETRVVVCRVAMPLPSLLAVAGWLNDRVNDLKEAGVIPDPAKAAPAMTEPDGASSIR